ncbi:MAG: twin-arginine translocase TatA/TatE family subunit [Candidatus Zixiibacteriota bacterium]
MFGMGPWEMLLIFLAILLLFGARRLPEIAQGLGKGIREFKRAMKDTSDEVKGSVTEIRHDQPAPPRRDETPPKKDEAGPAR